MTDLDRILDDCIDRMNRGQSIEQCLTHYQEHAHALEPLLRTAEATQAEYDFQPAPGEMQRARVRLQRALNERSTRRRTGARHSLFGSFRLTRPLPMAAIASVVAIALTALLVVWPTMSPPSPAPSPTPPATGQPGADDVPPPPDGTATTPGDDTSPESPEGAITTLAAREDGNFVFYLSDEPNAIGDFEHLTVTITSAMLKPHGDGPWLTFDATQQTADLVQLQGDRALELWRGDVPEGTYTNVFLNIVHVEGVLASTGEHITLNLPSNRLHLNLTFEVVPENVTEFVFDITVRRTGPPGSTESYLLLPQASDSGTRRPVERVEVIGQHDARMPDDPGRPDHAEDRSEWPSSVTGRPDAATTRPRPTRSHTSP